MGLRLRIIFAWIAVFGCASRGPMYNVAVSSYLGADGASLNQAARIHVYTDPEGTPDLRRAEVAHKIEYLLTKRGYEIAPADKADHVVFFEFGMGSHMETVTKYVHDPNSAGGTGFSRHICALGSKSVSGRLQQIIENHAAASTEEGER